MADQPAKTRVSRTGIAAAVVAAGILLSRIVGLVRDRIFAHFFGSTDPADAFRAALRIPNLLQNLFGEGVLSASFIPVYAKMLANGQTTEARRLAGAVGGALGLFISCLILVGLLATPLFVDVLAPGFSGQKRELTITLVRILFPGVGILVMSAWCLGILNSHGRFFVSYAAPVLWNAAIIAILIRFGPRSQLPQLAILTAWGAVLGSGLQLLVQIPHILAVRGTGLPIPRTGVAGLRLVITSAIPITISRGAVQISGYVDSLIASFLPTGAVAVLGYAQTLYLLPVSLFGMSVSAAELPAMAGSTGTAEQVLDQTRQRLQVGLCRILFLIVPSAVAFIVLGDVIVGAIYMSGRFGLQDTRYVWAVLAAAAMGLPPSTLSRLYCAAFFAKTRPRAPVKYSIVRVCASIPLGLILAFWGPALVGLSPDWGVVGLAAGSAIASILEYALLRRAMNTELGKVKIPLAFSAAVCLSAGAAAAAGYLIKIHAGQYHPILLAAMVLSVYGTIYILLASVLGLHQAKQLLRQATILASSR